MSRFKIASNSLLRPFICVAVGLFLLSAGAAPVKAGDEINTGYFGKVAIKGYDPVAYFTQRKAIKGSQDHAVKWLGAYWRFASEEHKQLFAANPQSFAPQYGGHCASGMAVHGGRTKDIDPEAWAIIDNKLYLNYSKQLNTLLTENFYNLAKADKNWSKPKPAKH